ncbi:MAG TPA: hypothetical protein ENJ05_10425, partial [Thiotrichales bacterium]|nr:hypothetical protein [Thiotrichales bacterium]
MYTQCPHCQAYFEVTAEQLKVGEGDVRCGQCLSIFNALLYLTEQLPNWEEDDANQYADWAQGNPPPAPAEPPPEENTDAAPPLTATDEETTATDSPSTPGGPGPRLGNIDAVAADLDPHIGPPRRSAAFEYVDEFTSQQIEAIKLPDDWLDEPPEKILADTLPTGEPRQTAPSDTAVVAGTDTVTPQHDTQTPPRKIFTEPPSTEARPPDGEHAPAMNLPAPLQRQLQEEKAASLRPPA